MSVASIVYTTLVWVCVHTFPEFFIRIFNRNGELVAQGIPAMRIYFSAFS